MGCVDARSELYTHVSDISSDHSAEERRTKLADPMAFKTMVSMIPALLRSYSCRCVAGDMYLDLEE